MYELLIVATISGSADLLSRMEKTLKDAKAENLKVEKMGKKNLAYPIKKQTEADFFVLNFDVLGNVVSDVTDMLRLEQEAVLRYLLIKEKPRRVSKKKTAVKKIEEEAKMPEAPKVTVVTTKVVSEKKAAGDKKVSTPIKSGSKVSKVAKVAKVKKAIKTKGKAKKK